MKITFIKNDIYDLRFTIYDLKKKLINPSTFQSFNHLNYELRVTNYKLNIRNNEKSNNLKSEIRNQKSEISSKLFNPSTFKPFNLSTFPFIIAFIFLLSTFNLFSQNQRPNSMGGGEGPKEGKVTGNVIDKANKAPIEYATISLFKTKDSSLVTGTITDVKGNFIIEKLGFGKYYAKISYIGYRGIRVDSIFITPRTSEKKLGTIKLSTSATELGDIVINAKREQVQYNLDKKVVDVSNNAVTAGGTAVDIMNTIPSVTVDIDGGVSLRGSGNVTILIDGHPSTYSSLDEIPASMIERVEIVTNPSAKYDPDGTSGIINIVFKKKRAPGYNGTFSLTSGTWNKYNGSANVGIRVKKFNLFTSYDNRFFNTNGYSDMYRESKYNDTASYLYQNQDYFRHGLMHNFKLGTDYFINDKNTITFSTQYGIRDFYNNDTTSYDNFNYLKQRENYYSRINDGSSKSNETEFNLNYRKTFEDKIQLLTVDLNYQIDKSDRGNNIFQKYYDNTLAPLNIPLFRQNSIMDDIHTDLLGAIDYVQPLGETGRMDMGYKMSNKNFDTEYTLNNDSSDFWIKDIHSSNHFIFNEQLHAVYGMYLNTFGKFNVQGGLRAEQALTNSLLKNTDSTYKNNYFSLFPTLHLKYILNDIHSVQVSYTRRVNRPRSRYLNPFINNMNPLNLSKGNPYLNPEYVNACEFEYFLDLKKTTANLTLFYREIQDMIARNMVLINDSVTMTTFQNLNNGTSFGVELVFTQQFYKWWRANINFSYFNTSFTGANVNSSAQNGYSFNTKFNTTLTVWENLDIQVSAKYSAPVITVTGGSDRYSGGGGQGKQKENYTMDIALKKDIFKNKANISLRVSDVFNTNNFDMDTYGSNYTASTQSKRESRVVYLGLTYKLNGGFKQKNKKVDMGGEGEVEF